MTKRILWMLPAALVAASVTAVSLAGPPNGPTLTNVPNANTKAVGYAPANATSAELVDVARATGSTPLENPSGIVRFYGYENDVTSADDPLLPQMVPTTGVATEAQKTEPDKNTYLVLDSGLPGADPGYDYGHDFLFQGHENGVKVGGVTQGYITRINLDADAAHRVTLVATTDTSSAPLPAIDGSTWDPWAKRLLFTSEGNGTSTGGVWQATPSSVAPSSNVDSLLPVLGRGGFEGIQNDQAGNLYIVEDIGGANKVSGGASTTAKRPNSFVYRFVPTDPTDLTKGGTLQALQVLRPDGTPITFDTQLAMNSSDQLLVHGGQTLSAKWVTVHTGVTPGGYNANAAAKAADATPFKRPENGVFRPGTKFDEFYFDETCDTDSTSPENGAAGGWGTIMKLSDLRPDSNSAKLTLFYLAGEATASFDNIQFLSRSSLAVVQDMGDTLHTESKTLDSGWVFDVTADYSHGAQPVRWLAEGRDPSATLDSAASPSGFGKNDADNEITGIHVSNGDPSIDGILGAKSPNLFHGGWRWFWTQQHGDNITWEVLPADAGLSQGDG
jgi:uncharacterized protein DUF839